MNQPIVLTFISMKNHRIYPPIVNSASRVIYGELETFGISGTVGNSSAPGS